MFTFYIRKTGRKYYNQVSRILYNHFNLFLYLLTDQPSFITFVTFVMWI